MQKQFLNFYIASILIIFTSSCVPLQVEVATAIPSTSSATNTPMPTATSMPPATVQVPKDQPTIQAGIDAVREGGTVLVAPGTYSEHIIISKTITLASNFHTTGDEGFISETIIDGGGDGRIITVNRPVGPETSIIGFTIQNGNDGIKARGSVQILNNHFLYNKDAVDYQNGGGVNRGNLYENNDDDGIDLDAATAVIIEDNIIRNNKNEGIEIRLHDYNGPVLTVIIRNNIISGNLEDGIQLIDYPGLSDRVFYIEHNLIQGNAMAGLGLMDDGVSNEDFRASSIPERIYLINNTFIDNPYAVSGGDNLIALNNLFINCTTLALKNIDANSVVAYNLFWNNAANSEGSNIQSNTSLFSDPLLDENAQPKENSPVIDAGVSYFDWKGEIVLDLQSDAYSGSAPDLGVSESKPAISYYPDIVK